MMSTDSTDKLIESLTEDATPVKLIASPIWQTFLWFGVVVLFYALLLAVVGIRSDIAYQLGNRFFVGELVFSVATSITAVLVTCCLAFPDCYGYSRRKYLPFFPLAVLIFMVVVQCDSEGNLAGQMIEQMGVMARPDCAIEILLMAIIPAGLLFVMIRRAAPVHYHWAGFTALMGVTSLAYAVQRLIEPTNDIYHILTWHILPMVILALVGLLMGRVWLRW